ncbi:MAG: hypothetical protein HFI29_05660 [Lachnospiraceae bacterium]|jgi:hypothetical protein|nr:hypothetical protein [Lachnospiraceae bacterium]
MSKLIDLTGQRFGRLVVLEKADSDKSGNTMWKCRCDCGTIKKVNSSKLRSGETKSCGCLRKETTAKINKGNKSRITHGMSRTRLYRAWGNMKHRCSPSCPLKCYDSYYGRGIRVCDEWKDFAAFADWALKNGYTDELTIDRIDNDGNYEPGNCRWVTREVQDNNRSNSRYITYKGKTLTVTQWAREIGTSVSNLRKHLKRGKTLQGIMKERGL